jgi:hypothetical protein
MKPATKEKIISIVYSIIINKTVGGIKPAHI